MDENDRPRSAAGYRRAALQFVERSYAHSDQADRLMALANLHALVARLLDEIEAFE